jgi:hypothetical protein
MRRLRAAVAAVTLLAVLAPAAPAAITGALAASLVMYRIIYYLLPLCGATAVLAFTELRARDAAPVVPTSGA